jgi:hypothetical protein
MASSTHTILLQGSWDALSVVLTLGLRFYPNSLTLQRKDTHTSLTMQFESEEMANVYTAYLAEFSKIMSRRSPELPPDTGQAESSLNEELKTENTT